jgi:hypothetical protein
MLLIGCTDQSKGAALSECRLKYYLDAPGAQSELIPDCMRAKSFQSITTCTPAVDEYEWDQQVETYSFDNPLCYRSIGSAPWLATLASPM